MKKYLFSFVMLLGVMCLNATSLQPGSDIILEVGDVNPTNPHGGRPRTPITCPNVALDGHTLYLYSVSYDLTLVLVDEEDEVVYTTFIPANTSSVVLPATLSGDYEIQLYPGGDYYFYGWIEL